MAKWGALVGLAVVAVLTGSFWWGEPAVQQPLEFPHKTHVKEVGLGCTDCHQRAEKDGVAGRPPTEVCLGCHSDETQSEQLKRLQALGANGGEVPWSRVWRLPPHVFFSHQIHVVAAKLACQTCHGPMETLDRPPPRPLKALTMNDCIGCHEKSAAPGRVEGERPGPITVAGGRRLSTDCNACHK